jgi:hypothetical protein
LSWGRDAPPIMKYYISLILVIIIGLALYERPVEVPVETVVKPQPEKPIGAKESVGAKSEPPAATF